MNNDNDKADPTIAPSDNGEPNELPIADTHVGFGRPPEATRFKKGISGNPKGRPKGSLNVATLFTRTLREKVVINEHGQRKKVTKLEAALKQLVNKAASGDLRALAQSVALAKDAEAAQSARATAEPEIAELDREVMEGILKRFEQTKQQEESESMGQ